MLEQIAGAQAALEADIELLRHAAAMSGDGAALTVAQNQMSRLSGLQHRVEHASGGNLVAIRAEVMASVVASQTLAQQARSTVAGAHAAETALHAASKAAHREVQSFVHDFYERKIFDPYLHFTSPEEEAAYRQREKEHQRAIKDAVAEGTPEGTLRATGLARAQLLDAGAHGADRSPDYQRALDALDAVEHPLERALGRSSEQARTDADLTLSPSEKALVSSDILNALRATGAGLADERRIGHGVNVAMGPETNLGRV